MFLREQSNKILRSGNNIQEYHFTCRIDLINEPRHVQYRNGLCTKNISHKFPFLIHIHLPFSLL